jgi:AcrR family transcriptional regulator
MTAMAATTEGLRERKKRQTRETIAHAAMALFAEHGFDAVTVADVARAADVSEKTVFNYFAAKEDLVLHGGEERRAALIEAIRSRPAGGSIVEPFRAASLEFVERVEHDPVESIVGIPRLVAQSRSLRDRLFLSWEQEASALTPVVAEETGAAEGDLVPAVVARSLAWTHRLVFRSAFTRLLAGENQRAVAADLREQTHRAYETLEQGLAGYGVEQS